MNEQTMHSFGADAPRRVRTDGLVSHVRPTIVAAVGGTGVAAAKYTIASMQEMLGSIPSWFAVRAFDTDVQDNRLPRLTNNVEFVQLSNFNVRSVLDAALHSPELSYWKEWLPPLLSAQQISTGVGGVRPKGRLCYCYKREQVKASIQAAMGSIRNSSEAREIKETKGLIVDVATGMDVHIISSVCGGTGSSMFLDLAYDIRNWARGLTTGDITVTGHLVLPGAFARRPVLTSVLEANAYAALQELDRFMLADQNRPWRMQYGLSEIVESSAPPFDYCYLLDGVGPGGITDVDEIVSVIGDVIAQMSVGAVGAKLKTQIRNTTDTVLSQTDQKDRRTWYSSYGLVMMEVNNDLIVRKVTAPIAHEVANDSASDPSRLPKSISAFKRRARLLGSPPRSWLIKSATSSCPERRSTIGATTVPSMHASFSISKESFNGPSFAISSFRSSDRLLDTLNKLKAAIDNDLRELLRASGGPGCMAYLRKLALQIENRLSAIREAEKKNREEIARREAPRKDGPFDDEEIRIVEDTLRCEMIAELLGQKTKDIENSRGLVSKLHDVWESFCNKFEYADERASELAKKPRGGRVSTVDKSYFKTEHERRRDADAALVGDVLKTLAPRISEWGTPRVASFAEEIRRLCAEQWRLARADQDCEESFLDASQDKPGDRLRQYLTSAMPMWEIDDGYHLADKIHEISVIGTFPSSQLYEELQQSESNLQACDDQRTDLIPIIRTQHGLSLIGLKRLSIYRRPFIRAAVEEQRWDFHLWNDRRWVSTMELPDEDDGFLREYRIFSLANWLELFTKHEFRGYEFREDALPPDTPPPEPFLTRRAVFVFLQDMRLFDSLEDKINTEIDRKYLTTDVEVENGRQDSVLIAQMKKRHDGIRAHIDRLKAKVDNGLRKYEQRDPAFSERVLKADVSQIHTEIRALNVLLKERQLGL